MKREMCVRCGKRKASGGVLLCRPCLNYRIGMQNLFQRLAAASYMRRKK